MFRGALTVDVTTPPEAVSIFVPGAAKLGVFVRLKRLGTKLHAHPLTDLELLEQRQIQILEAVFAQDIRARIAVSEVRRHREGRLIKPLRDRRIVELAGADAVGPLAADAGVRHIARDGRRERPPAAQHQNALHLPAAQHPFRPAVRTREKPLALPKRQFITGAGASDSAECRTPSARARKRNRRPPRACLPRRCSSTTCKKPATTGRPKNASRTSPAARDRWWSYPGRCK